MTISRGHEPHFGFEVRLPRQEDGTLQVSNSDIGSYKNCRRSWYLGSMLGLRDKHQPVYGPLVLGTRVHNAFEAHYGMGMPLVETYNDIALEELRALQRSGVVFDESAWRKEAELGQIMLQGFEEWARETGFDGEFIVKGTEQKITHRVDVNGTPVSLRGKVDLRVKMLRTGQNMILDWKTTSNFTKLIDTAHMSEQLKMYMMLERLNYKDQGVEDTEFLQGGMLVMLLKSRRSVTAKPPFFDTIEVHHSKAAMNSFYRQTIGTLSDYVRTVRHLEDGVDHRVAAYPTPGEQCRYCPFKDVCNMLDDSTRVDDMLHDLYYQGDPHERYQSIPEAPETLVNLPDDQVQDPSKDTD